MLLDFGFQQRFEVDFLWGLSGLRIQGLQNGVMPVRALLETPGQGGDKLGHGAADG